MLGGRAQWAKCMEQRKKGEIVRFANSRNVEMMDVGKDDRLSRFNDETDTTSRGSGHREIEYVELYLKVGRQVRIKLTATEALKFQAAP